MAPTGILSWEEFQEQKDRVKPVPRYDSANELKIPHPWWDLDKTTAQTHLKNISETVFSATKGTTNLDRELKHVSNTATKLEHVERAPSCKTALIGVQGAGKSQIINALLDCPGLSLTGAKGWACTSAIVKYAYWSGAKFGAEVQYLSTQMREAMIDEHIRSYLHYHNDLEDSDDEDGPRIRSVTQDDFDRKRKQTAEDFFENMFGTRDDFLTAWSSNPVNTGEFKSLCQLKCKDAMEAYEITEKGAVLFSKASPKELLEDLKPFLADVSGETCLWPLVDCITIRFRHPLLEQGHEFIDLPGSGDVNMLRARHADAIKDTVDIECILADTIRIATDDLVISKARAAVLTHGAARVKIVATKIDAISDEEVSQSTGELHDELNILIENADEELAAAEENDDDAKCTQILRYKQYLQRSKKAWVIEERASDISTKLGDALKGISPGDCPEVMHTSASNYLIWIKNEKTTFKDQPALSPEETGIPALRRFFFDTRATQNLKDHIRHVETEVPAFVEKLKRVVTQSDRDVGFITIANEIDELRGRILGDMSKLLKWHCLSYSLNSVSKIKKDSTAYKEQVKSIIQKRWTILKSAAFTRLLKSRGTVFKGTSKAKGLENTVNWNSELASILRPGFHRWYTTHSEHLRDLRAALPPCIDRLYYETLDLINKSAANLITVEKVKLKWVPLHRPMQSKLLAMVEEMIAEEKRLMNRATLEEERENIVIAAITDNIFDDVLLSAPALKVTAPGKPKRYVTSILKFRKARLEEHFLNSEEHFVDRTIQEFKNQLDLKIQGLIDKHIARLHAFFDDFSKLLRDHAPIDYIIDPMGEETRGNLEKQIPFIKGKAEALRAIVPVAPKPEDNQSAALGEAFENDQDQVQNLTYFLDKVKKRKHNDKDTSSKSKKIKHESS